MKPFSEKQRQVALWWTSEVLKSKDGIIADGAIRSGKTISMICGFLLWSQSNFSHQDFIIAGRTMGSLVRNVVSPMLTILGNELGWTYTYNRSYGEIKIGTNTYHLFGASSEQAQDVLQGMTAAGCFADEVALFPQSFVDQMTARCSVDGSKWWFNCNPSSPVHFFKTEFIDKAEEKNLLYVHFLLEDNLTLSQAIRERYERQYSGVFYDRYIRGLWVVAEGLIYKRYQEAVIEQIPEVFSDYCISCDYGTQNAFAALKWGKNGNTWYVIDEYYYSGRTEGMAKTDDDYLADMIEFAYGMPNEIEFIVDPSAASFITSLRKSERFRVRKAKNAVAKGINHTAVAMQRGLVKISDKTTNLLDELAGYFWYDSDPQ
jgi:PBSX family phage terminase large subunit